jgi:hypothetical protein
MQAKVRPSGDGQKKMTIQGHPGCSNNVETWYGSCFGMGDKECDLQAQTKELFAVHNQYFSLTSSRRGAAGCEI